MDDSSSEWGVTRATAPEEAKRDQKEKTVR